jgi:hypothetical protein
MGPFCVSDPFVPLPFFSDYSFRVHQSLTRMTGNYLHMQWPLTSQLHGSFLKENN